MTDQYAISIIAELGVLNQKMDQLIAVMREIASREYPTPQPEPPGTVQVPPPRDLYEPMRRA